MISANYLRKACLGVIALALVVVVAAFSTFKRSDSITLAAQPKAAPVRNAYFGNLHIHTSWSNDAYNMDVRATPDDSYLYGKGEPVRIQSGAMVQLERPLDFMGVTEHAEYQGIMSKLQIPNSPLYNNPYAIQLRSKDSNVRTKATMDIMETVFSGKAIPEFVDKKLMGEIWQDLVKVGHLAQQARQVYGLGCDRMVLEWAQGGSKPPSQHHFPRRQRDRPALHHL